MHWQTFDFKTLNPAQQIRAMQRQHSNHSNLSSSPEKSVDGLPGNMDRWKMESTESFRSMMDTLSQTGTVKRLLVFML